MCCNRPLVILWISVIVFLVSFVELALIQTIVCGLYELFIRYPDVMHVPTCIIFLYPYYDGFYLKVIGLISGVIVAIMWILEVKLVHPKNMRHYWNIFCEPLGCRAMGDERAYIYSDHSYI